jgi:hypothetical protein
MSELVAQSDDELLSIAAEVLADEGFVIERSTDALAMVLAENAYFVVGVVATATIQQLVENEANASERIAQRLASADSGSKVWDGYLVLLTQEVVSENSISTRELFDINYDTTRIRRIAHAGVEPTTASIGKALVSFLRPLELDDSTVTDDPLELLVNALTMHGVDRELGARAAAAFSEGVPLDNVL